MDCQEKKIVATLRATAPIRCPTKLTHEWLKHMPVDSLVRLNEQRLMQRQIEFWEKEGTSMANKKAKKGKKTQEKKAAKVSKQAAKYC